MTEEARDARASRRAEQTPASPSEIVEVLVVDDHQVVRQGLIGLLASEEDIEVIAEASNGRQALDRMMALHAEGRLPQVVLMDLQMEPMDGIEATRAIRSRFEEVEIVVLTSFVEEDRLHAALDAGAAGYVLKDANVDEIVAAVRAATRGELHLDAAVTKRLMRTIRTAAREDPGATLSERELEILRLLAAGRSNKEIAAQLVISERTARTHVSNILRKLGLASRTQAALWAVQEGLNTETPRR
jgi:DNA-binding NarL/FixJ family response regulator